VNGILVLRAGASIACNKNNLFFAGLFLNCHFCLLRWIVAGMEVE
jgi:hypothetical protein